MQPNEKPTPLTLEQEIRMLKGMCVVLILQVLILSGLVGIVIFSLAFR